jgi:DNA-binding transcriptional LysR family regulator
MFDLQRLRLLRELAHRGTMTAVGEAFGLTSSAVSQQLAVLEHEARAPLLERFGRRVRLTADGERLVIHAETILAAVEAAVLDLKTAGETPRGVLEVGCFPSFAKAHVLPAAIRLRKRFPDMKVHIHELEPPDAIEAVRDGRCQLAVRFTYNLAPRPDIAGLVSHPLLDEQVLLALPKSWQASRNPIDLKRLAQAEWMVGSRQSDDLELAERACAVAGFVPRIAHTVDDYDLLLRMVAAGFGVGFIPELGLQFPSARAVVVRRSAGVPLHRHIDALTRRTLAASPMVQALLSELTRVTAQTPQP